jgi:hypothetical protein
VIVETHAELASLVRRIEGVEQVIVRGGTGTGTGQPSGAPPESFDFHVPLLSVPLAFGTQLATIPRNVPYVRADPERARVWKERLVEAAKGTAARVGLVWAGNPRHASDRHRSMPLEALAPLARVPGITWFSLQKGAAAEQVQHAPLSLRLIDIGPQLHDFDDTAAVLTHMSLLIAVDTAPAHLAGAMGRPVWTLLSYSSDWRWLPERQDSPWYPTMRLFRQTTRGDWASVIQRVANELATAVYR